MTVKKNKKTPQAKRPGRKAGGEFYIYEPNPIGSDTPGQYIKYKDKKRTGDIKTLKDEKDGGKKRKILWDDDLHFAERWMFVQDKGWDLQKLHREFYWITTADLEERSQKVNELLLSLHDELTDAKQMNLFSADDAAAIPEIPVLLNPLPWRSSKKTKGKTDAQRLLGMLKKRNQAEKSSGSNSLDQARETMEIDRADFK